MIQINELQALQNAVNNVNVEGLGIQEKFTQDKRKTLQMYFLTMNGTSISPVLDYENMNHFILGIIKAKQLFIKQNQPATI